MNEKQAEEIIGKLDDLKRLLILALFDRGFTQGNIAKSLGTSQPTISRMFPKGSLKRSKSEGETD